MLSFLTVRNARKHLHLYIGRQIRKLIDSQAVGVEDRLFLLAVRQMNLGSELMEGEEEKVELARLQLRWRLKCHRLSPLANTYKLDCLF
jgi:hypothetical protein